MPEAEDAGVSGTNEDVEVACSNNVEVGRSTLARSEGGSGAEERIGQSAVAIEMRKDVVPEIRTDLSAGGADSLSLSDSRKEKGKDVVPQIRRSFSGGADSLSLSNWLPPLSPNEVVAHGDLSITTNLDRPVANHSGEGVSGFLELQDLPEWELGKKMQNECQSLSWKDLSWLEQVPNPQVLANQLRKGNESRKGKEKQLEYYEGISRDDMLKLDDYRIYECELDLSGRVSAKLGEGSNRETQKWKLDPTKLILQIKLASGAFGTVYKGLYDGQVVAVKTMKWGDDEKMAPGYLCRLRNAFKEETEVWRKLHHRNVTKFIGVVGAQKDLVFVAVMKRWAAPDAIKFRANDFCFIVEEYVPGGTLREYLNRSEATLPSGLLFKMVMELAIQIVKALRYIHKQNVVHRDVKCENILVTRELDVKLTNFGIARPQATDARLMTGDVGTLGYIAPEVLTNRPYDHKCDVFSFGIVLWEIVHREEVNRNPAYWDTTTGTRPSIDASCPAPLARLITKCWDANPQIRPNMSSVLWSLEALKARNRISDLFRDMVSGLDLL